MTKSVSKNSVKRTSRAQYLIAAVAGSLLVTAGSYASFTISSSLSSAISYLSKIYITSEGTDAGTTIFGVDGPNAGIVMSAGTPVTTAYTIFGADSSNNVKDLACSAGQVLQSNGTNRVCATGLSGTVGTGGTGRAGTATSDLAMAGYKITGMGEPTTASGATTKNYVDTLISGLNSVARSTATCINGQVPYFTGSAWGCASVSGSVTTLSGDNLGNEVATTGLSMAGYKIIGMDEPKTASGAATKNYVDTAITTATVRAPSITTAATGALQAQTATASGPFSLAWGETAVAQGEDSTAFGLAYALGQDSVARGLSRAFGAMSTARGNTTRAGGSNATARGNTSIASGTNATARGSSSKAPGAQATARGSSTIASGDNSTAWGGINTAVGLYSTVRGFRNTALGDYSTILGIYSISNTGFLFAIGNGTGSSARANAFTIRTGSQVSIGSNGGVVDSPIEALNVKGAINLKNAAVAACSAANSGTIQFSGAVFYGCDGTNRVTFGSGAGSQNVVFGGPTGTATGDIDMTGHLIINLWTPTTASGAATKAYVDTAIAAVSSGAWIATGSSALNMSGYRIKNLATPTATGDAVNKAYVDATVLWTAGSGAGSVKTSSNVASGQYSTARGSFNTGAGDLSTARGGFTNAAAEGATAWGTFTNALGQYSTVRGMNNTGSANYTTLRGVNNLANATYATARGYTTQALGTNSTARGSGTSANTANATAFGLGTVAMSTNATALGAYNIGNSSFLFSIGIGTSVGSRANAFTVRNSGQASIGSNAGVVDAPIEQLNVNGAINVKAAANPTGCSNTNSGSIQFSGDNFYGCTIHSGWVLLN